MNLAKTLFWMTLGGVLTIAGLHVTLKSPSGVAPPVHAAEPAPNTPHIVAASPGRVEGASEPIEVGAAADGVIAAVLGRDGQFVQRGAVLAQIACLDLEAEGKQAIAERDAAEQRKLRLLAGSRPEERAIAAQKVATARAVAEEAERYYGRINELARKEVVAQAARDKAKRDFDVSRSQVEEAERNFALVQAPPVKEDAARADAELDAAVQRVRSVQERLAKCTVRTPISGTILRSYAKVGESFSTTIPRTLFTIADLSSRRVRAEVDERDVGNVAVDQSVEVSADAYPGRVFHGRVVEIYSSLGRKTVRTGDPSEKADRDVLEALIQMEEAAKALPLSLRVTVRFMSRPDHLSRRNISRPKTYRLADARPDALLPGSGRRVRSFVAPGHQSPANHG